MRRCTLSAHFQRTRCVLQRLNAQSLRALLAFANLELDSLVFLEGLKTGALDFGVVNEYVVATVSWGDEPEALLRVEPLHSALCHYKTSQLQD